MRFLQKDTDSGLLRNPITQHPYLYVGNDPLNYVDPTGNVAAVEKGVFIKNFHDGKGGQALGYFIGYLQGYGVAGLQYLAGTLGQEAPSLNKLLKKRKGDLKFTEGLESGFNAGVAAFKPPM